MKVEVDIEDLKKSRIVAVRMHPLLEDQLKEKANSLKMQPSRLIRKLISMAVEGDLDNVL